MVVSLAGRKKCVGVGWNLKKPPLPPPLQPKWPVISAVRKSSVMTFLGLKIWKSNTSSFGRSMMKPESAWADIFFNLFFPIFCWSVSGPSRLLNDDIVDREIREQPKWMQKRLRQVTYHEQKEGLLPAKASAVPDKTAYSTKKAQVRPLASRSGLQYYFVRWI